MEISSILAMAKSILDTHHLIQKRVETEGLLVDPLYEESLIEDIKRLRELAVEDIQAFNKNIPDKVNALGI